MRVIVFQSLPFKMVDIPKHSSDVLYVLTYHA